MLAVERCHAQVESRIVNQYQMIRLLAEQCLFGYADVAAYIAHVRNHLHVAHVCHLAVVLVQPATGRLHLISSQTAERRLGVTLTDSIDQSGGMHVTRSFAGYEEVLCHG